VIGGIVLNRLFHIAVNSQDLERSVAFYRGLGFTVLQDREVHNEKVKEAFAVPTGDLRFVHLRLGDSEDATLLDIVEWGGPGTADGSGPPPQHQQGITRFAVLTDDADRVHRELSADGVQFLTSPTVVMTPEGGWKVCLAVDPDGVVVQVTELLPAPEAERGGEPAEAAAQGTRGA
jgi:catechol 2,3-dioxygenase-like lactoylglutathione lyase family enzyme